MTRPVDPGTATHRVPVIDKMMQVLLALETEPDGASVSSLSRDLKLSRTTVYRMLNTLCEYGVVARNGTDGVFALGPALVRLARRVPTPMDVATASRPHIEALAHACGRTVKVSVREQDEAVVVAVAMGSGPFSIGAQVGRRFPLHAGAASKLLLAFAEEADIRRVLRRKLSRHTDATIVDRIELAAEIATIRRLGWAEDRGEFVSGVRALATPIRDAAQRVIAALSVTFVANADERTDDIVDGLRRVSDTISRSLGA